jgi:hypothetical protein
MNLIAYKHFDLIIIGAGAEEIEEPGSFGYRAKKLFSEVPCRVWFCKT